MKVHADQAVILAAGRGTRLGNEYTKGLPKCLLELGGQTLLRHQIAALQAVGVRGIVVVTGYRKEQVEECGRQLEQLYDG